MPRDADALDQFLALPDDDEPIRGFSPDLRPNGFTGAAELTIPVYTTPARGISLDLALSYDSGAGNGEYGIGFSASTPVISRMTGRGVPTYTGTGQYTMTGAGPLTPMLDPATSRPALRLVTGSGGTQWEVGTFLPCQQESLPLIEQWTDTATGVSQWRVVSAAGVTSIFGATGLGRVSDPADPARVFQWLIEDSTDRHGNKTVFEYKAENSESVRPEIYEQGRVITARRYLKRIRYGNYYPSGPQAVVDRDQPAALDDTSAPGNRSVQDYAFEVVFDYGEHDLEANAAGNDPAKPVRSWTERADPFSSYIAGFEIRTFRLCRGVLMLHHFPAELGEPCLVRATRFGYREDPSGSLLTSVTSTGYRRQQDGSYQAAALPPLSLSYSLFTPSPVPRFRKLDVTGHPAIPGYLAKTSYLPLDLAGEGLPGFLLSVGDSAWYYPPHGDGRYGAPSPLPSVPDTRDLAGPGLSAEDLDGDGGLQLLVQAGAATGYFARTGDSWAPFTPLRGTPTSYQAPRAELADLDGDGRRELLFVQRDGLLFYPSRGTDGFAPAREVERQEGFPASTNTSVAELVTFAPVFGDGLTHRARVTDGQVAVWPSLGHGRFAPRVLLGGAPRLPGGMDVSRVYLADLDLTGTADLVQVFTDRLEVYRNQSGNSFSAPITVPLPFQLTSHDQISFADVTGGGTTAIVVSRMVPVAEHWYCDLCAGEAPDTAPPSVTRPNLLTGADNNLGASVTASYASSTRFLLGDKARGRPWLTRMPVAVQVVATVSAHDRVALTTATTSYSYHDGYYDPRLRQFQGFGLVDSVEAQAAPGDPPATRVRTWYHNGSYPESAALLARRRSEFFSGDPDAYLMPDSVMEPQVLASGSETAGQAYRALAGRVLRTEVYGEPRDGAAPYAVTDHNYTARLVQAAGPYGPGAFFVTARETMACEYDRDPADPRIQHTMLLSSTLAAPGAAGTYTERGARVSYPRRPSGRPARDRVPEQQQLAVSLDWACRTRVTGGFRMVGMPVQTRQWDLGGLTVPAGGYFSFAELTAAVDAAMADEIPYGTPFTPGERQARPATWERIYYWDASQSQQLPLGEISPAALRHHTEQAAFSAAWRADVFGDRVSDEDLAGAGYLRDEDGYWWRPGNVTTYYGPSEPAMFMLAFRSESFAAHNGLPGPFAVVTAGYDAPYCLAETARTAYADQDTPVAVTGSVDYQAAQLWELADGNGALAQVLYDPLADVLATSVFKPASGERPRAGDMDLRDYLVRAGATFSGVLAAPGDYLQGAASFRYRDRLAWLERGVPSRVLALTATGYVSDSASTGDRPHETVVSYCDAHGRQAERRQLAGQGDGVQQWAVSERTAYLLDGRPASEYLPWYAATAGFTPPPPAPPPRVFRYDAAGRQVQVDQPKGVFTRTVYTPWHRSDYDENDTVLDSAFYQEFMASYPPAPDPAQRAEKTALVKASRFYATPEMTVLDPAGNPVRSISDSLGTIAPDAFAAIVDGSDISSRELWDELHARGYLVTTPQPAPHTSVTALFEPYTPGFRLRLDPPYGQFAAAVTSLLVQACLTSLAGFDLQARLVRAIDPRLLHTSAQTGSTHTSAEYAYPMGSAELARSQGADAGTQRILTDTRDRIVSAWDGRGVRMDSAYDGLDRMVTLTARSSGEPGRTLEMVTYGEHQPSAAAANLIGRVYQVKDETGVLVTPQYTIAGLPAARERQYTRDYAAEPDWSADVPLDPQRYRTVLRYDALGRLTGQVTPDGAVLAAGYGLSGRPAWLRVTRAGIETTCLAGASYNAAGQRLRLSYGNGAEQVSEYDGATQRLTSRLTRRPDGSLAQQLAYTYDPVGNVMAARDQTAQLVFGTPQPESDGSYTYDGLYRLRQATGIQHPGIGAATYATGFKQTLFASLAGDGPPTADLASATLEPYTQTCSWDASGNLVSTRHTAPSGSFTRDSPVEAASNRLAGVPCDGAGNPLTVEISGDVALTWDTRGNLAATSPVPREAGSEQSWFCYDCFGERSRTVVEQRDAAGNLTGTTELRYLGSYVERRVSAPQFPGGVPAGGTLRAEADPGEPVTVIEYMPAGQQPRYQVRDLLGSVAVELAGDGAVLTYEGFFPAGGSSVIAAAAPAEAEPKVQRYSGEEADDSTGLYYYGSRYLASWQGRWLSPDPSGPVEGLNLYAFVNGEFVTMLDAGGRGKVNPNQPKQPPSQLQRFRQGLALQATFMLVNAPWYVFVLAPVALYERFYGTPQRQAASLANRLARREERNLKIYALLIPHGINPELLLPESVLRRIRPQSAPLSTWHFFWRQSPLESRVYEEVHRPETWGGWAGSFLGTTVTVGLSFALARFAVARLGLTALTRLATLTFTPVTSTYLLWTGQAEESDRVWAQYQADNRQAMTPRASRLWLPASWRAWLGNQAASLYEGAEQGIVGVPRHRLYASYMERQTEPYREWVNAGLNIVATGVLLRLGMWFGPSVWRWAATYRWAGNWQRPSWRWSTGRLSTLLWGRGPGTALTVYRPPVTALVVYVARTTSLALRGTTALTLRGTTALSVRGTNALTVRGTNALTVRGTNALTIRGTTALTVRGTTALTVVNPQARALVPYVRPVTSLTTLVTQGWTWRPRGIAAAVTAVTAVIAYDLYSRQRSQSPRFTRPGSGAGSSKTPK